MWIEQEKRADIGEDVQSCGPFASTNVAETRCPDTWSSRSVTPIGHLPQPSCRIGPLRAVLSNQHRTPSGYAHYWTVTTSVDSSNTNLRSYSLCNDGASEEAVTPNPSHS